MNMRTCLCWWMFVALLGSSPSVLFAQGSQSDQVSSGEGRRIGAPQVLEIPVQELPAAVPSAPVYETLPSPSVDPGGQDLPAGVALPQDVPELPSQPHRRTYLGVLYATAEEGPAGVKVLSVVAGSPAARAGFQGADAPEAGGSSLFKAAIVVLAMSPAGPFAIPLAIAHDMYTNRHPPGDLIVAVDNQPVRNAQEFSDKLRAYRPGDTVVFSVVRAGKPLQLSVQLEEEPM
ncbi:MAG: PDZ domain-containing protein [Candidatus Binatia bacterium]|nr:PDZ domain-containing protein [Candidatus Binatia bacterium]